MEIRPVYVELSEPIAKKATLGFLPRTANIIGGPLTISSWMRKSERGFFGNQIG